MPKRDKRRRPTSGKWAIVIPIITVMLAMTLGNPELRQGFVESPLVLIGLFIGVMVFILYPALQVVFWLREFRKKW